MYGQNPKPHEIFGSLAMVSMLLISMLKAGGDYSKSSAIKDNRSPASAPLTVETSTIEICSKKFTTINALFKNPTGQIQFEEISETALPDYPKNARRPVLPFKIADHKDVIRSTGARLILAEHPLLPFPAPINADDKTLAAYCNDVEKFYEYVGKHRSVEASTKLITVNFSRPMIRVARYSKSE